MQQTHWRKVFENQKQGELTLYNLNNDQQNTQLQRVPSTLRFVQGEAALFVQHISNTERSKCFYERSVHTEEVHPQK